MDTESIDRKSRGRPRGARRDIGRQDPDRVRQQRVRPTRERKQQGELEKMEGVVQNCGAAACPRPSAPLGSSPAGRRRRRRNVTYPMQQRSSWAQRIEDRARLRPSAGRRAGPGRSAGGFGGLLQEGRLRSWRASGGGGLPAWTMRAARV